MANYDIDKIKDDGGNAYNFRDADAARNVPTFSQASSRTNLAGSGETIPTILGKVKKWLADLKSLAFKDKVSDGDINDTISDSHIASAATWNGMVSGKADIPQSIPDGVDVLNYIDTHVNKTTTDFYRDSSTILDNAPGESGNFDVSMYPNGGSGSAVSRWIAVARVRNQPSRIYVAQRGGSGLSESWTMYDLSSMAEKNGTYPDMSVGKSAELLSDIGDAWYDYVDNASNGNANQRYEIWFTGSTDGCANILVSTSVRDGSDDPWPLVFVISCEVNSSNAFTKNPKVAILYSTNHSTAAKMVTVKYGTHSVDGTAYPAVFIKFADSRKHNMFISVAGKGGKANGSRTTNTAGTDCGVEACVMTSHVGTAIGNASNTPVYVQPSGFLEKCSPMVPVTDNSTSSPEWNDFTETGVYQLTSSGGVGTKHSPESGRVGLTVVNAGGYITQLAVGSDVYYRTRETSGTWHAWQTIGSTGGAGNLTMSSSSGDTLSRRLSYKVNGTVNGSNAQLTIAVQDTVGTDDNTIYFT